MKIVKILSFVFPCLLSACQPESIGPSGMIDDHFFLQVDGQSLPIKVAGSLAGDKLLLILHGGPGASAILYRSDYAKEHVEKELAVVYWDQRFAGGAQGKGGRADLAAYKDDLEKVLLLLKAKYGDNKKIYLLGHSWGGFLAPYFLIDENRQGLVDGWVQVAGAHNYYLNDSLTHQMLLEYGEKETAANKNMKDWAEIIAFCRSHHFNESFQVKRQLAAYAHRAERLLDEVVRPDIRFVSTFNSNRASGSAQLSNLMVSENIKKIDRQAYEVPISEHLHKIGLPVLLLWGKYDFVCPTGLKEDIRKNMNAHDLSEMTFYRSGHSPMFSEPKAFWEAVLAWVNRH